MSRTVLVIASLFLGLSSGVHSEPVGPVALTPTAVASAPNGGLWPPPTPISPSPPRAAAEVYAGFDATVSDHPALVALTRGDTDIYEEPGDTDPVRTVPGTTVLGTATVLAAIGGPVQSWIEVMLPGRPNAATGWIEVSSIDLYAVDDRIVVDLGDRELTYYRGQDEVLTTTVAVGSIRYPTPVGTFFVTDRVMLSEPDGPWGPAALGLSGRSDVITEFNGGDGIIGIHGTNRPDSLGESASLGCLRVANEVIIRLHAMVPLGALVEIEE